MAPSATLPDPEPKYVVVHAGKGTIKRQILKGDQKKPTFETIPQVDFTNMSSPSLKERKAVAEKVGAAFKDSGFLYAVNHGIDEGLQDELYEIIKEFFALPLEEKMKVSVLQESQMTFVTETRQIHVNKSDNIKGYEALLETKLDASTRGGTSSSLSSHPRSTTNSKQ